MIDWNKLNSVKKFKPTKHVSHSSLAFLTLSRKGFLFPNMHNIIVMFLSGFTQTNLIIIHSHCTILVFIGDYRSDLRWDEMREMHFGCIN